MHFKVYGIPNCDTVKKALLWLKVHGFQVDFLDYKKDGISTVKLKQWCGLATWETIFNIHSSTWKKLVTEGASLPATQAQAIALMHRNSSIIKRPIIEVNGELIVGFNENEYIEKIIN